MKGINTVGHFGVKPLAEKTHYETTDVIYWEYVYVLLDLKNEKYNNASGCDVCKRWTPHYLPNLYQNSMRGTYCTGSEEHS